MAASLTIKNLVSLISDTQDYFKEQAQKQVNTALTLRNLFFGLYIAEYELNGEDRAEYGKMVIKEIANRTRHIKGMSERNLYLFKTFYQAYPNILQSVTAKSYLSDLQKLGILQSLTAKFTLQILDTSVEPNKANIQSYKIDENKLIDRLSFTHFIELLKTTENLQRVFYEIEAIKNNWSVRELQRAMNSMLFERTGLSTDKIAVIEKHAKGIRLKPEDVFRNPYMFEFLGLEEKAAYSETDLESAIINHLQHFLLELGRGFCFEARQKRITFDNRHYHIDLVFYHRLLKSHVLIDLKIGEFDHGDAGQMNVYLNYYKDNEKAADDNDPVGIILCAGKNENLVKYATSGLPQKVFVNKYMVNLPNEDDLKRIIKEEQDKLR
ncbi:MAG: PDDEXK nuclease domain-containing protein [Bacteroidota bacterium]